MKNRIVSLLLCLVLGLALCLPAPVWAEPGTVRVTADIDGVEIYVNGTFTHQVTPADVKAAAGDVISLWLPGYTAAPRTVDSNRTAMAFSLAVELYPAEYEGHVTWRDADSTETLCAALDAAAAQGEGNWTVIRLSEDTENGYYGMIYEENGEKFRTAYHYTLYGGEAGAEFPVDMGIYGTTDVRLVNLHFPAGRRFHFRVPGGDNKEDSLLGADKPAINTANIYILGCTVAHEDNDPDALGIGQCIPYGCGGSAYEGNGTVNWYGIHFSNNDIQGQLFNFAAAGDGDYNTVRDYTVCANRFPSGGVSFLCADAHSWYVYENSGTKWSGDWTADPQEFGYCEHNRIEDIRISGNTIRNSSISLLTANLGNRNNAIRRAVICNNTVTNESVQSKVGQTAYMWEGGLSLCAAVVADKYGDEMVYYPEYLKDGFTHTDGNVLEDVTVADNTFQCGYGRGVQILGVETNMGRQCGRDNVTRNITVERNDFTAAAGVRICGCGADRCTARSDKCENNVLEDVIFRDNTISHRETDGPKFDAGLLVAGQYLSKFGEYRTEPEDSYPDYSGVCRRITVSGNAVTGYTYGILVAGGAGDYARNMKVTDVAVTDNTVVNRNFYNYALLDIGILAAGSTLQTGIGEYTPLCNQNCAVENLTVSGNTVTARVGVLAAGLACTRRLDFDSHGNTMQNVTITGNTLTQRPLQEELMNKGEPNKVLPAIVTADIFTQGHDWQADRDGYTAAVWDVPEALAGCRISGVTVKDNASSGFPADRINVSGPQDFTRLEETDAATAGLCRTRQGDQYLYTLRVRYGYGDLNEDGALSVVDMQRLFEYLSAQTVPADARTAAELTTAFRTGCDVNGDGGADILDYQALYLLVKA